MDSHLFSSRVLDTFEICERSGIPKFLGFLNEEEAATADAILQKQKARFQFFGGYEEAGRQMLCCYPEWCDNPSFPICAVTFSFRGCDKLSHRDVLGSLMSLGLTRESVGDILVEQGRAVVFLVKEIAAHVKEQTRKIGSVGVASQDGFTLPLPGQGELADFSDTIASARLDCVVSALAGSSRSKAVNLIESGLVTVNSFLSDKATKLVQNGDVISVRGKGKFIISSLNEFSKKGRIIIKYKKYI